MSGFMKDTVTLIYEWMPETRVWDWRVRGWEGAMICYRYIGQKHVHS